MEHGNLLLHSHRKVTDQRYGQVHAKQRNKRGRGYHIGEEDLRARSELTRTMGVCKFFFHVGNSG
jgi:hypothetical protein